MKKYKNGLYVLLIAVVVLAGCLGKKATPIVVDTQSVSITKFRSVLIEHDLEVDGTTNLDGTSFDVDVTGAISLDADAASNFNVAGAGIDLTLESEAGTLVLKGDEAAATGVTIDADDAAGTGATISVGSTGGLNITGGLTDIGGGTCGTAAGDNDLCVAADLEVDNTLDVDGSIDLDGSALDADVTGGISLDADTASNFNVSGSTIDLTIESEAGRVVIKGDEAAADGVYIDADDAAGTGLDIDVGSTGGMSVDGGCLNIGGGSPASCGDNDAYVTGDFEVDGAIDSDGGATFAGASTYTQVNGAGASANPWDYTGTTGIMDGSDNLTVIDINMTSANHTSTSNVVAGIDLSLAAADPDAEESAIIFSAGWDNDLNAVTSLDLAVDDAVIVVIADPPAANASGDLIDVTATNLGGDGSDVFKGLDINLTGTAGSSTNTTTGIELGLTSPQGTQTETAIALIDKNWDIGIDLGGNCLDLDDAATTSICADTDNTIDIEINGADDFQLTANTFSVLSGSTLTIDDGAAVSIVATNAASASANPWDYTATAGIMNGSDTLEIIDINMTGANHTGADNTVTAIAIDLTTPDPQVAEVAIDIDDTDFDYAIDAGNAVILNTAQTIFVDFYGDALPGELILLSGNDAEAVDPAIVANEQYGVVTLVTGDVGDTCANDCSELGFGTVYKANQGGLVFEIRLHIDTAITNASICAGFTDVATIELPAKATGGGDGITAIADDAIAFCFDDAATTKEWFSFGIDGTTQATGNGMVGVGPTHSVYQVLRIEVDPGGEDARFYIDGALVDTLTANVVLITADLMPFVGVDTNTTASVTIDVDYVFVSANR